ncbi:MAG TPA: beta-phosphoglucomutase family hydrolase [Bryobacteraceae bacterium]|nr:beta-phosphoglucomutase family hydrolase [Bryobacteraceae bacterium]
MSDKLQSERAFLAPGLCLIFDMDGVIIDSNPVHRQAWAAFNGRFGLETTEEMQQFMYGKRNDQIVRGFFGDTLTAAEVTIRGAAKEELYREMVGDRMEEILVPGIREFLEAYPEVPKAVATNGEPANADFVLDRASLRSCFQVVVSGDQVHHPKPHPEIYLRAAELLGAEPSNCIVFEDSLSGVEAARAAAMKIVLVRTTHENLPGASLCIDNFESGELRRWLADQGRGV